VPRIVKVTAEIWVDVDAMWRNEEDIGFDMGDDPVSDAEDLVRGRIDSLSALAGFRVRSTSSSRLPANAERP
jgi:hypothetical protein